MEVMLPAVALSGGQLDSVLSLWKEAKKEVKEQTPSVRLLSQSTGCSNESATVLQCSYIKTMFCSESIEATEGKANAPEIGPAFVSESLFAMKIVVEWPGVARSGPEWPGVARSASGVPPECLRSGPEWLV